MAGRALPPGFPQDAHVRCRCAARRLTPRQWWYPDATREIAEAILGEAPPGSFLVRPSSHQGNFALSYTNDKHQVVHHVIHVTEVP